MCKECGMTRCPSGCPNAEDPETLQECSQCGTGLSCGDFAYLVDGEIICENCMSECLIEIK